MKRVKTITMNDATTKLEVRVAISCGRFERTNNEMRAMMKSAVRAMVESAKDVVMSNYGVESLRIK